MAPLRLVHKQEVWRLTKMGWLVLLVLIGAIFFGGGRNVAIFLSLNDPVTAEILVVEGWMPDYALADTVEAINGGKYRKVLTTGLPLDKGSMFSEYTDGAEFAAARLRHLGADMRLISAVAAPVAYRDRTWHMASAVRDWLNENEDFPEAINLVSISTHARRSRMLYQRALGSNVKVGVISVETRSFDIKNWWKTSAGVKTTIMELISYLYAKLNFSQA